jgi:hypothetical protein
MAGNSTTLTIAGDADSLQRAARESVAALDEVSAAVTESAAEMSDAAGESVDFSTKLGHLGSAVSGATDALDTIGGSLQAVSDLQQAGANRAAELRRAIIAVESAQEDLNQSFRDGARAQLDINQATLDLESANLDAEEATRTYNEAVKEFGKDSLEARRASLELRQAQQDAASAVEDGNQAHRDAAVALIDAKTAQEDLIEAQKEANPSGLQEWANNLEMITPLITAVVGIIGLVTAAQWLWNASLWASPVTWIVLAVAALIAIIIVIATQTTWFQDIWNATWGGIKDAAQAVGDWFAGPFAGFFVDLWDGIVSGVQWVGNMFASVWNGITSHAAKVWDYLGSLPGKLGSMFASIADYVTRPFRAAFNAVSSIWNSTVGRLSWTVPGWVPFIGGNSISAPKLPHFHSGGVVSGALGAETLAVLQAGERVTPAGGSNHSEAVTLNSNGSAMDRFILESIRRSVGLAGGDPVRVLRATRG